MRKSNLLYQPSPEPSSPTQTLQPRAAHFLCPSRTRVTATGAVYVMSAHMPTGDRSLFRSMCFKKKKIPRPSFCNLLFSQDSAFEVLLHKYITILFSQSPVDRQLSCSSCSLSQMPCNDIHVDVPWVQRNHVGTEWLGWRV